MKAENHLTTNHLSKLIIHNFQSHRNTSLDFAPPGQLTVIVGPSDNGKTAIIRALKLLAYNSPQGTDYIRVGENDAQVQGIMADGSKVTRQRTRGGVNRYILESAEQQRQIFEGFGVSVPLEVQQLIGMSPITIGDMEFNLNLSEQLDGPFLGNGVPVTAKAKVLGKLSGVEEVDYANKTLGTDLYRMRREKEGIEARIKSLTEQIKGYDYLDELGALISVAEDAYNKIAAKQEKKEALLKAQVQLAAMHKAIQEEQKKVCRLQFVDTAQAMLDKAKTDCGEYDYVKRVADDLETAHEELSRVEAIIDKAKNIPAAMELLNKVTELVQKIKKLHELKVLFTGTLVHINSIETKLERFKQLDEVREELAAITEKEARWQEVKKLYNEATSLQGKAKEAEINLSTATNIIEVSGAQLIEVFKETKVCPTCGRELSGTDYEKLVEGCYDECLC